jgi:hypothetical protein
MPLQERKYKFNQSLLKVYGTDDNKKIKLVNLAVLRTSGIEDDDEYRPERGSVNDEKLAESIRRTKQKIFELAFCNPWQWFFNGTLDKNKQDRTDLELYHKQLTQWLRNYSKRYGVNIKFIIVPEKHEDGENWHTHGFMQDLPVEHLRQFQIGDVMGKKIAEKVKRGEKVYNWESYAKRFGFCDLEPIQNHEAISKYITKYISKSLAKSVTELNAHMYYRSRGLKQADVIKKGTTSANVVPTYKNEYCSVTWLDYSEELLQTLKDSFS